MANYNECDRLKQIIATRPADVEQLAKHLTGRMSLLLYGPVGIGKKTLIDCLAFQFSRKFKEQVCFYRVDFYSASISKWDQNKCNWDWSDDPSSLLTVENTQTTPASEDPDASEKEAKSGSELPFDGSQELPRIDLMLQRVERKLSKGTSDYTVLFLEGFRDEIPLSDFLMSQIGTIITWIRRGISVVLTSETLLSEIPLSEKSENFADLYRRDVQKWVRHAVGLIQTKQAAEMAAKVVYEANRDETESSAEAVGTLVSVAGPYPGHIDLVLKALASTVTVDTQIKSVLMKSLLDERYYPIVWASLTPRERSVLAVASLMQLDNSVSGEEAAWRILSQRRPSATQREALEPLFESGLDWDLDSVKEEAETTRQKLASAKRLYGQLLLPWDNHRVYSEAFAQYVFEQLPRPQQVRSMNKLYRRDTMLLVVTLGTLLGFVSILVSMIGNTVLLNVTATLLGLATILLVVYFVFFFVKWLGPNH
jgi:hypothetical protein